MTITPGRSLDLYADPACPWSWLAVRWLTAVAPERGLRLTFRSYSLWMRDGDRQLDEVPEFVRMIAVAASKQSLRLLRVFEALRAGDQEHAIERLYLAWGNRVFVPGPPQAPSNDTLEGAVATAGLEGSWLEAADDPRWDAAIEASNAALSGVPVVPTLIEGGRVVFHGAVLAAPVTQGLELWDALDVLATEPSFVALTSPRPPFPSFAPVDNPRGAGENSVTLVR
ncbi:DsbA family protein [Kribbella sp. NBC_00482]|uniref:mycothiol-dependent nitroreductase Rv2466c family protein n=1 Tax=Kribbella sp. NBC_00482 TaxID=2975968 RepID=UPI002E174D39